MRFQTIEEAEKRVDELEGELSVLKADVETARHESSVQIINQRKQIERMQNELDRHQAQRA